MGYKIRLAFPVICSFQCQRFGRRVVARANIHDYKLTALIFGGMWWCSQKLIHEIIASRTSSNNRTQQHNWTFHSQQFRKYYFSVKAEANNWMKNLFSIETSEMPKAFTVGLAGDVNRFIMQTNKASFQKAVIDRFLESTNTANNTRCVPSPSFCDHISVW